MLKKVSLSHELFMTVLLYSLHCPFNRLMAALQQPFFQLIVYQSFSDSYMVFAGFML